MAGVATFALYAITLAPTTAFWDTSEYIATAHILGIPHPPGNPLFVVLARAWELLLAPTGLSVAVRINLFSAFMGALAHGCWFLLAHRILAFFSDSRSFRLAGAAAAVIVSATAFTVWNQSNVNEKVYTVSLFTIALLSWLAFRWRDHVGEGKDDNLLLLGIYVLALSVGNHLMAFLAAPALFIFILFVRPASFLNWKLLPAALLAVVIGLSVHLYLPIRAELGPIINENDPTCESVGSAMASVLTMGRRGCDELSASLSREQYRKPSVLHDPIAADYFEIRPRTARLLVAQIGSYLQYFDWQWARSVKGNQSWFGGLRPLVTILFVGLGMLGAVSHYRRDRSSWAYVLTLFLTLSLGLVVYLNFEYGFTYPNGADQDAREVRERDYFFIVSFSIWGLWAGIGIAALWLAGAARACAWLQGARRRVTGAPGNGGVRGLTQPALARLATAPILLLALVPAVLNWSWATRATDTFARDWAYGALMSVGPYGVLFTNGDNDTFPLWYLQEVEGVRRDVTVIITEYLKTPWYARQIRDLTAPCEAAGGAAANATVIVCQRAFDAAVPGAYAAPDRPPRDSVLPLTDAQIAAVASGIYRVREPIAFRAADIETTIEAGTVLEPADTFITAILRASLAERPIHFMAPSPHIQKLSLTPYTLRTGLTLRLSPGRVTPAAGSLVALPAEDAMVTGRYVDLDRTERLLAAPYRPRQLPESRRPWVDSATTGIGLQYAWAHVAAARGYAAGGDAAAVDRHMGVAQQWAAHVR
jgi:hypothetical protein